MSHVEQLERETEQMRTRLASTLDELRASMTPGHVLDQLSDRLSDGAPAALARNLKEQAVSNPLPLALMGASLAWLMMGPRPGAAGNAMRRTADRLRDTAHRAADTVRDVADDVRGAATEKGSEWRDKASRVGSEMTESMDSTAGYARRSIDETGQSLRETAASTADSAQRMAAGSAETIRETAGSMADSVQRSASAGYEAVADTARRTASSISETTKAAGEQTLRSGTALRDFCRDQPLLMTGLGIAIGALVGALLPATETEERVMGAASETLKKDVQELASEQYEGVRKVGEHSAEAAQDEAARQAQASEPQSGTDSSRETDGPTLVPSEPRSSDRESDAKV